MAITYELNLSKSNIAGFSELAEPGDAGTPLSIPETLGKGGHCH